MDFIMSWNVGLQRKKICVNFLFQIKFPLLNCFTTGEEHRLLFLWCVEAGQRDVLKLLDRLTGTGGDLGRGGREEIASREHLTVLSVTDDRCHFAVHGYVSGKGSSLGVPAIDLEGWGLWDTQDKHVFCGPRSTDGFFNFLNHLAVRAPRCLWILLSQLGNLFSWQPQMSSPSPYWCWRNLQ